MTHLFRDGHHKQLLVEVHSLQELVMVHTFSGTTQAAEMLVPNIKTRRKDRQDETVNLTHFSDCSELTVVVISYTTSKFFVIPFAN